MKKTTISVLLMGIIFVFQGHAQLRQLEKWRDTPMEKRKELTTQKFAEKALSKEDSRKAIKILYPLWLQDIREEYAAQWRRKAVHNDSLLMRFKYKVFGNSPADGRSLWISLHGGGNVPPPVNEHQYENQLQLYQPEEGIYLAPRAPWDDWDMWFKPGIDELYDNLIRAAVAFENVDPDKVYLLGYSAGGDGLYRLAPRMADRWAAASMMAGHPGDVSMENVRNLPFMIWAGEYDNAYDRNKLAAVYGAKLDSLQKLDTEGYVHETHIVKGKSHWMDLKDKAAVPWMAKFKRNPYPHKIVWRQQAVLHPSFYWLSVERDETRRGMEVRARIEGNTVIIDKNDYRQLTIRLNDQMIDLDKPIIVKYGDNILFNGKVPRNLKNIVESWNARKDISYVFPARLTIVNNAAVK
ncbi:MAG TPA: alpha/beta hydrolase [Porphyromonadaceae bacterium]|jgi:predicted peptidase|nr:alpha/beta hydrolase [Porphyromonadaceae bacterium]HBX19663.1 alpha/beta hydrolase [Porphyromonadaceae bacterium]HCM20934.1 alpha/beta hydrolase [Porphyromonadaceae bacterium]